MFGGNMVTFKPFAGFRVKKDFASLVLSPPYDVISSEEAREMAKGNKFSFLRVTKPEIDLDPSVPLYDDRVYQQGSRNLRWFIEQQIFHKEKTHAFYIYEQTMGEHVQTGIFGLCAVKEYESGLIKRHEHTRKDKEDDRTRHVTEQNANSEPVFLFFKSNKEIVETVERCKGEPAIEVTARDGVVHKVFVVDDPATTQKIETLFHDVDAFYVADGHHRTKAYVRHGQAARLANPNPKGDEPYEFFMAVVFPHDQLMIMDYNRVVADLAGLSPDKFLAMVGENFEYEPTTEPKPSKPREFGMFFEGRWYRLRAKPHTWRQKDPVASLDCSILQDFLLNPILGIKDPRTDHRIDFVGGIRGIAELEKRCNELGFACAFALYPVTLEQLMKVADAGMVMPPKSTWFEPKLGSGLVFRLLDE
jgi:uncharacterized protein (DUF1015 family)